MKNNFHKKLQLLKPHERLEIKTYNDISHIYNFEKETDVKLNYHFACMYDHLSIIFLLTIYVCWI